MRNYASILLETLIGIVKRPYEELKKDQLLILGLFKGLMGALFSLFIKPTVGMYDLLLIILEGLKNEALYEEHIMDTRSRPPRTFGDNNLLIPFDFVKAMGEDIIKRYNLS